jgi:predicted ATPase
MLVSGKPGIGKSRLAAEIVERIAAEPNTRLRYFCTPHHTESAYYPIIRNMERGSGFEPGDGPQAKLDKLDALLTQTSASVDEKAIFAELLSLPWGSRYPMPDLAPQEFRRSPSRQWRAD